MARRTAHLAGGPADCEEVENLSLVLWRERELLETLQCCLEQEQLVLTNDRTRWLARVAREVDEVLTALRETELLRSVAADAVARSHGLPSNPSLRAIAAVAGEPWRTILLDHHAALIRATAELSELAAVNRELLRAGHAATREALTELGVAS